ncbi:hypothetical protein SRHO_G00344950 [Serrasalmus rhombeus]
MTCEICHYRHPTLLHISEKENVISSKDLEKWPYLRNVDIKEIDADVELLIGVNTPKAMEPWEIINSIGNGPYAVRTMLGWIVNGPLGSMGDVTNHHVVTTNRISVSEIEELLIKQYNQEFPETHYTEKREMSLDDKKFMKILTEQVTYENSHYYLPLPFRNDNVMMPNNREVAIRRAASLAKRLKGDKSFQAEYKQFMDKMLEQDYAEEIPLDQLHIVEGKIWYVPHHGVYHRRKGILRVVFDCTSSFQNTSLNKELLQGPDLTNNLLGVLMRFRQGHIALMADIQAMFHQVRVHRKHVDFLRFLWWPDGDFEKQPEDYRMKVHLFGAISSPSCANFALQKTAQDNQHNYDKEVIETIQNNFYVDDCLKTADAEMHAIKLHKGLSDLCSTGGFKLTKWVSNSKKVLEVIPENERADMWNHFKRALAWFLRLKDILKTKIQGKDAVKINSAQNVGSQCLSVDELERAENAVISYVQNSSFHEEVEALQKDVFKEKQENRRWQISVQNGSPQTYHLLPIDILLDSEPDEDPQMLSSPKHPYSPCDEMENLADIIRDFKRENISEHSTLTVVARRRRILHSAITALNKGYFDWHKRPQIEFVGEMADDYGGPTREFFSTLCTKKRITTERITGNTRVWCHFEAKEEGYPEV